jgi:hypothetical protein
MLEEIYAGNSFEAVARAFRKASQSEDSMRGG